MRDQCGALFKSVRKELIRDGIVEKPQSDESIAHEVDAELAELTSLIEQELPYEELHPKLQALMEKAMRIKHGLVRQKRIKNVKAEIIRAKKQSSRGDKSNKIPLGKGLFLDIPNSVGFYCIFNLFNLFKLFIAI